MRTWRNAREVSGDAGDAGAGDCQGGALWGEGEEPQEDWVSAGLIGGEIAFEWAGSSWSWMWRAGFEGGAGKKSGATSRPKSLK